MHMRKAKVIDLVVKPAHNTEDMGTRGTAIYFYFTGWQLRQQLHCRAF